MGNPYLDTVMADLRRSKLGKLLTDTWNEQQDYNDNIQKNEGSADPSEWTQTYLLGLMSEIDEVLRELHWKRHRKGSGRVILSNMGRELADLTKYVFSLWQAWGFSEEDMLRFVAEKNEILEAQWKQDQDHPLPHNKVILFDLDGTVADYRKGLAEYLEERTGATDHRKMFYQMDLATGLDFEIYHEHKDAFEENGGYRELPEYPDAIRTLNLLKSHVSLVAVTARPKYLARSWADTYYWLKEKVRAPDRLWLCGGERLSYAKRMREQGYKVVCWEDSPVEALRFAEHGFRVWMRDAPYNRGALAPQHENIVRFTAMPLALDSFFERES